MLAEFPYCYTMRVRYSEIDGQMIVYNSHYLTYLDLALTEYFRDLGVVFLVNVEAEQFDYSLVNSNLSFHRPAYYDDILEIYVRVATIGKTSFTVKFLIMKQGEEEPVATAEIVYVGYDAKSGQKIPVPEDIRSKITRFQASASIE